tara:strand:+ start:117 stop:872 length:756 start_codon:yes stop_codon:yes gene_type:complete
MNKGFTYERSTNIEETGGDVNKVPNKDKSVQETVKDTLVKLNDLSPIKLKALTDEKNPVSIISNNYTEVLDTSNFEEKKDFISPNPQGTTEYRFIDGNFKTAWSTDQVSQHPKYYTSNVEDEKVDIAGFFNNTQFYHDRTSPNSTTTLPERCRTNSENEVFCDFNNRLQLVPPKLINDSETSGVLNSIGNNIYKTVDSTKVNDISGNNYQIWEYTNEKSINGGEYFNGVYGSSSENEVPMEIGSIKPNYSF